LLGSHKDYNLEHYTSLSLETLGCEVAFLGYREFLGSFRTMKRMIITRSNFSRRLAKKYGLGKFNGATKLLASRFQPDLVLVIKGEALLPETLDWFSEKLKTKTALWYPDDPRYFNSLSKIVAPHYDFIFTPSMRFVDTYTKVGAKHTEFLPFACEPSIHRRIPLSQGDIEKFGCDISFVGTFSRARAKAVGALEAKGFKIKVWGLYWRYFKPGKNISGPVAGRDLTKIFNASKIVLNVHNESDLNLKANMRVFEAAGCRSLLLTDNAHVVERHFIPGQELVCYANEAEMIELADMLLESCDNGNEVANRANDRAYKDHTYTQRIEKILQTLN
jgi:spore maturation protein CgeB